LVQGYVPFQFGQPIGWSNHKRTYWQAVNYF
jgi:hypothetical protein